MTAYGFFVGLAASLMGIRGGDRSVNMILTLHGKSMHSAVATSAGLGVPITIAGTIGYIPAGLPQQSLMPPLSLGFVSLIGFALMAPVSRASPHRMPAPSPARTRSPNVGSEVFRVLPADCLRRCFAARPDRMMVTDSFAHEAACRRAPPSFPAG